MTQRSLLSFVFFALAAAWPAMVIALERILMSPLQRALNESICGGALHSGVGLLGHCAICWEGSTFFAAIGALILLAPVRRGRLAIR